MSRRRRRKIVRKKRSMKLSAGLTGYSQAELDLQLENKVDFETFFAEAPQLNASRKLIKGVICGVRVEEIEEPTMQEIRYLDKLIDELAKGKAMGKNTPKRLNE